MECRWSPSLLDAFPCRRLEAPWADRGAHTAILAFLHISLIIFLGAFLFTGVDWLEPNRRFAIVLKCAILAAGGVVIAKQLLP